MLTRFVDHLVNERSLSPNTAHFYQVDMQFFQKFVIKELDGKDLLKVTSEDIQAFVDHMGAQLKPSTICRKVASLSSFYRFAVKHGLITDSPIWHGAKRGRERNIKTPTRLKTELSYLSTEQTKRLVAAIQCDNQPKMIRDKALYYLMIFAGLRAPELQNISLHDVDLTASCLKFYRGSVAATTELTSDVYTAVSDCYFARLEQQTELTFAEAGDGLLFVNKHGNKLSTRSIRRNLDHYAKAAGIKVTPSQLRHSFAIKEIRQGTPVEVLQKQLGHKNLVVTKNYLDYQTDLGEDLGPAAPIEELEPVTEEVTTYVYVD